MHCDSSTIEKQDWPWVQGWYVHFFPQPLTFSVGICFNKIRCFLNYSVSLYHSLLCKGLPHTPNCEASSQPQEVSRSADRYLPHIEAVILVNAEAKDGEFLRAEIMSVLRLTIHQMRQKRLIPHMKIPVQYYPLSFGFDQLTNTLPR